jgi:hypothetical protein
MSWRGPSTPNPPETNPRLVFERLFGTFAGNNDPQARAGIEEDRKSILDTVTSRTRKLMGEVGPSDRRKIDEYFSSIQTLKGDCGFCQRSGSRPGYRRSPKGSRQHSWSTRGS